MALIANQFEQSYGNFEIQVQATEIENKKVERSDF